MIGTKGLQPLYRTCSLQRFKLGNRQDLVHLRTTALNKILPERIATLLDFCHSFAQIDVHVRKICERLGYGPGQFSTIKRALIELVEAGLLVSDAKILSTARNNFSQNRGAEPQTPILGITTSGRPACLLRCLQSYASNVAQFGRNARFVVVDDTGDSTVREKNLEIIGSIRRKFGIELIYIGESQRQHLASELVREGILPDVVNFALFKPTQSAVSPGANRNALLLSSIGSLVTSVDDDVVCNLVESPSSPSRPLALSSAYNPWVLSFYPDREKLLESLAFVQLDYLGAHLDALGQTTAQFLTQFQSFSDVRDSAISNDFMEQLERSTGRILVTQVGIAGNCGFGSPSGYLTIGGATRARLLESEAAYNSACVSGEILGSVDTVTLSDSCFMMAGAIGLDNREGLAPFFPVFRGEDAVFGALVRRCFANSLTCHLPMAVFHAPPFPRSFAQDAVWQDANRTEFSSLILLCINSLQLARSNSDDSSRLRAMGTYLMELGSLTDSEFWSTLQNFWFSSVSQTLMAMEDQRHKDPHAPRFWLSDMEKYIDILRDRVTHKDSLLPQDLNDDGSELDRRKLVKERVKQYGILLKSWPDIIAVAKGILAESW